MAKDELDPWGRHPEHPNYGKPTEDKDNSWEDFHRRITQHPNYGNTPEDELDHWGRSPEHPDYGKRPDKKNHGLGFGLSDVLDDALMAYFPDVGQ